MKLVYIGLWAIGISSALLVSQVFPTIKKWWKCDPYAKRTRPRVKTTLVQNRRTK